MDWNTTCKGMLKITKYFLVLETPGFPPTVPLGSVDLSPGLRFSVTQQRTQVWCSQHGLQGSLCLLSWAGLYLPFQPYPLLYNLARTCPAGLAYLGACGGGAHGWTSQLYHRQCLGYSGAVTMKNEMPLSKWEKDIDRALSLNLSQRQIKADIRTILSLSQRTKCQAHLWRKRPRSLCWSCSPVCPHLLALSEIAFLVSWLRQSSIQVPLFFTWAIQELSATQGAGSCGLWSSRPPAMEVGEESFSDQLPEFFLFTSVPVVKAADRPEGSSTPLLSHILFCHPEWPLSKPLLVHPAWRHPAISTTHPRKFPWPALPHTTTSLGFPSPWNLQHSTGSPECSIFICICIRAHKLAACRLNLAYRNILFGP